MTATGPAAGAPVERPAPAAKPRYDFAKEVGDILTAALARDDARIRRRCPRCGRRLEDGCQ